MGMDPGWLGISLDMNCLSIPTTKVFQQTSPDLIRWENDPRRDSRSPTSQVLYAEGELLKSKGHFLPAADNPAEGVEIQGKQDNPVR